MINNGDMETKEAYPLPGDHSVTVVMTTTVIITVAAADRR